MRQVLFGLVLLLFAGLVASPVEANPFAGKPSAEPALPPAAPGIFRSVLVRVGQVQRELNATLSRQLRAIKETGSVGAALAVAGVAFTYGVLHAAGPGHGKLVVSSLFLGRDATIPAVFLVGSFVSLLQTLSAIVIVGVYGLVLHRGGLDALQGAARFEVVSYALVVLIGLYMLWAVLGGHAHHAHGAGGSGPAREDSQPRSTRAIVIATGLTPCASALILMIFALANGVFLVGIGAALVMAVGMSLTVAVAGLLGMTARAGVLRSMAVSARAVERVRTGLSLAGALMITGIGFLFLASAWTRLQ